MRTARTTRTAQTIRTADRLVQAFALASAGACTAVHLLLVALAPGAVHAVFLVAAVLCAACTAHMLRHPRPGAWLVMCFTDVVLLAAHVAAAAAGGTTIADRDAGHALHVAVDAHGSEHLPLMTVAVVAAVIELAASLVAAVVFRRLRSSRAPRDRAEDSGARVFQTTVMSERVEHP